MGSNLGDREENLSKALELLLGIEGTELETVSSSFESEPMYLSEQPDYLNLAAMLLTSLSPLKLLEALVSIENEMGRVREVKFGPRVIDLDILFFGKQIVNSEALTIPHPLLYDRLFVLKPLSEIAGELICPVRQKTITELLKLSNDSSRIEKYETETPAEIN
ncbi:MAG: 2-amino-4-hydroxy-6-hydroxymethyldihydropteridine diphosphokinase [Candidatus Marinimicrobia bacterium]|nr:2-amino-4-hydroxy-6-hydroxymethyldihydropteridine diphosphokinase [Candidatus Neomarinimicrobiota bacterium]